MRRPARRPLATMPASWRAAASSLAFALLLPGLARGGWPCAAPGAPAGCGMEAAAPSPADVQPGLAGGHDCCPDAPVELADDCCAMDIPVPGSGPSAPAPPASIGTQPPGGGDAIGSAWAPHRASHPPLRHPPRRALDPLSSGGVLRI